MGLTFQSPNPVILIEGRIGAARPRKSDLVAGVLNHRTRILQRNERHQDADGRPYAPYSNKGPIYVDVTGGGAPRTQRQRINATRRFARKVGLSTRVQRGGRREATRSSASRDRSTSSRERGETRFNRIGSGVTPINGITPGGRLKVASYRAYKLGILGRSGVDLRGARAPHMLNSLVVKSGGAALTAPRGLAVSSGIGDVVQLGIFGSKAEIAQAHNTGVGRLPRRRFLAFGRGDVQAVRDVVAQLSSRRLRAA